MPTPVRALCALSCIALTSTAHAAFVSCEDAKNYGENSARLYVGQSFSRIACDGDLLIRFHAVFDRVLSRQVLRTTDSDDEKLCYYEGLFEGLTEELRARYAACDEDPRFACLSGAVLSSHAGSVLSAVSLSLSEPASVEVDRLTRVFEAAQADGNSACTPSPEACHCALLSSMTPLAQSTFGESANALSEFLCSPAGAPVELERAEEGD